MPAEGHFSHHVKIVVFSLITIQWQFLKLTFSDVFCVCVVCNLGEVVLFNIFYEVFTVCTSVVAEDSNGRWPGSN